MHQQQSSHIMQRPADCQLFEGLLLPKTRNIIAVSACTIEMHQLGLFKGFSSQSKQEEIDSPIDWTKMTIIITTTTKRLKREGESKSKKKDIESTTAAA